MPNYEALERARNRIDSLSPQEILDFEQEPPREYVIHREPHENQEIGMAGVVIRWGVVWPTDEIGNIIAAITGDPRKKAIGTGFDALYRTPEHYDPYDIIAAEEAVWKQIVDITLSLNDKKPSEIGAVVFAGDWPEHPMDGLKYLEHGCAGWVAKTFGMTKLDIIRDTHNYCFACDASAHALRRVLTNPRFQDKDVLLWAASDPNRTVQGFDLKKADHLSLQFFSAGGAGLVVRPGVNMRYLSGLGEYKEVEDTQRLLGVVVPWRNLIRPPQPGEGLTQTHGNITILRMPEPEEKGKLAHIKGLKATAIIAGHAGLMIKSVALKHREQYPNKKMKMVVSHHASLGLVAFISGLLEKDEDLKKAGIKLDIPWVVRDGNAGGPTGLIALVRQLERFEPGNHIIVAGFGGGLAFDAFGVEIGESVKSGH